MEANKPGDNKTEISEWLTEDIFVDILKEIIDDFAGIKNYNVMPAVATGENFMTVLLNVLLEIELKDGKTQQHSFMTKVLPNIEQMRKMLIDWRVFEKELNTYESYIPEFEAMFRQVGKEVCFGAKIYRTNNEKAPKEFVIMEDLRTKGFKNTKRQEGLDKDHTEKALDKLAQFHAASACRFEEKGPYPDMYNRCLCSSTDLFKDYRLGIATLLKEYLPLYGASHLAEKLEVYSALAPDQFQTESKLYSEEFHVLNHGDCWSNNIMFRYNADGSVADAYFVDFQMSSYGSPAHDLSYLLLSSTKLDNKLKYFDYFISYYHNKLMENLRLLNYPKKLPTLKDLHISLFRHSDWCYTITTTVMPVLLLDPTEKASIENVVDDGKKGEELKRLMFSNSRFVSHMKELLPWMDYRGFLVYDE